MPGAPTTVARHWLRIDVRDGAGKLILLGNPIHLNPTGS